MSSLPEKSQQVNASVTAAASIVTSPSSSSSKPMPKTFFFRTDSIKKIKCTAVYPFQVAAGMKLNKNAIIELLETNIKKARICAQKAMLNFYCVILKLLSTLFALWDEMVQKKARTRATTLDTKSSTATKSNDANNQTKTEPSNDSYQSRLAEKLMKIQKHKNRLSGNSLIPSTSSASSTPNTTPALTPSTSATDLRRLSVASSTDSSRSFSLRSSRTQLYETKFQEYCMVLCVHAGLVVMYLQVLILGYALNTSYIPSGLIFLLTTVGIIGYFLLKVSLTKKQESVQTRSPRSSPAPEEKNSRRDPIKDDFSPERQSRSKAKKSPIKIDFKTYKTLSKVELL